jgi:hypothetical protein
MKDFLFNHTYLACIAAILFLPVIAWPARLIACLFPAGLARTAPEAMWFYTLAFAAETVPLAYAWLSGLGTGIAYFYGFFMLIGVVLLVKAVHADELLHKKQA